ncbi:peptidase C39 [Thiocapsa imhoffii]|uniref:Peptidase C39 n=2 Tax=Thiocapsa imhoffii TaxID=382777 RepID=A0A9X1BA22_9GAMM|nr:peptidase C39 [Thiocapsa imhoffii]
MRRDNVVIQEWDLSCGAAALTTLLNQEFSDPITEQSVATALMQRPEYIANPELVSIREGFSLLDLKRLVDARGYHGVGLGRMTVADLERRAPVLVPINSRGYNHFVVFRGRVGDRVLLADPAWGNRTLTVQQFERAWIEYPRIGHVGFVVETGANGLIPTGGLNPELSDFFTFN